MFKIGEFSKLVRVSARMLRYYEKCGLLKPASIDTFTGYRMYSAKQIPHLMRIISLRDMGFVAAEIVEALPHFHDGIAMKEILERKQNEIRASIAIEQSKLEAIDAMNNHFFKECFDMVYDVIFKSLQAEKVISIRESIPAEQEEQLWDKLFVFIKQNNIVHGSGGYSIYHSDEYEDDNVDTEIAVPVTTLGKDADGFKYKELPQIPKAATIRFSGSYENYSAAMEKLALWIEENGYEISGVVRGFAISSHMDGASIGEFMTELQVPVRKM